MGDNLTQRMGAMTISGQSGQTTPRGSTITPGKPVVGSTKGTGMGKIL